LQRCRRFYNAKKLRKEGIPMAGRKPKPTAVKKLEGNSGKRKLNTKEPVPAKGMPDCPEWLLPEAKDGMA
jgi:phage terminase small subunit